jgi:hypothetical protein
MSVNKNFASQRHALSGVMNLFSVHAYADTGRAVNLQDLL